MQQRLPSLRESAILFAHRGARAYAPENTVEAFSLALRLGANGLETDAWITSDNHVVLDHDGVVKTRLRKRAIADVPRSELPSHVPTLGELLDTCRGNFDLSIDVKDPRAFLPISAVARECGFASDRLWLCHPDYRLLEKHRATIETRLVDSTRLSKIKEGPERRMSVLRDIGIDCINMHNSDWNGGLATLAHKFGRLAFGWDAQHDVVLDNALRMGLDAVYSDFPDRMVDAASRLDETSSARGQID